MIDGVTNITNKYGTVMGCHQSIFFNKIKFKNKLYYDLRYPIFEGVGVLSVASTQKRKDKYLIAFRHYGVIGLLKVVYRRFLYAK